MAQRRMRFRITDNIRIFGSILLFWTVLAAVVYFTRDPTAVCNDGHLSYSTNHSGTCSWHGGVRRWIAQQSDDTQDDDDHEPPEVQ